MLQNMQRQLKRGAARQKTRTVDTLALHRNETCAMRAVCWRHINEGVFNSIQQLVGSEICGAHVGGVEDSGVLGSDIASFRTVRKIFIQDKNKITALLRTPCNKGLEKPKVVARTKKIVTILKA
jgi:hypothetical protein